MIALSIACTVAETIPPPCDDKYVCHEHKCGKYNQSISTQVDPEACRELWAYTANRKHIFFLLESICVIVFTFEYIGRFLTAPSRFNFVKNFMSIIDLLSILPYYIGIFLEHVFHLSIESLSALVLLRVLRVFRVLKFSRHSSRLRSLLFAIQRSASELGFIVFSFTLGVTLISSLLYFVEKEGIGKDFSTIPAAMWYSFITMTTTG